MNKALVQSDGITPLRASATSSHDAASQRSVEMSGYYPSLKSADAALLPERDLIQGRAWDQYRNSGWAVSGVQKLREGVIGSGLRLSAKPNYRALNQSFEWGRETARLLEQGWINWAGDPDFPCDVEMKTDFNGMCAIAFNHYAIDGEAIAVPYWMPERGGRYALALRVVDPDRLCNPDAQPDTPNLRGGVEKNKDGAPVAYHFRNSHPSDLSTANFNDAFKWTRVPAFVGGTRRRGVIHAFMRDKAGATRGRGLFTPILERMQMERRWSKTELQSALIHAVFAAFVKSPFDQQMANSMLDPNASGESLSSYQDARSAYHDSKDLSLDGARIPKLFPGEELQLLRSERPNSGFSAFQETCLRYFAASLGISYEQISMDWSKVNYSSARAALLEVWRHFSICRAEFVRDFVQQVYVLLVEEMIDRGEIDVPQGAPGFRQAVAAWTRARWIGPPRGYIDPVKEATAADMRMQSALSTLEDEAAEQGKDWEEIIEQRRYERQMMAENGVPPPEWSVSTTEAGEDGQVTTTTVTSSVDRYERQMAKLQAKARANGLPTASDAAA
jgi:lambda family phage portal protein